MRSSKQTPYGLKGINFKDLINKKYGMLTVVGFVSTDKNGTKWKLRCECGGEVIRLASNFKKKQHKHSCGCISKNPGKKGAGFRRLLNDYKSSAKNRGVSFNLTKKKFKELVNANCYYCNEPPGIRYAKQVVHALKASGIDRMDNSKGYNAINCVSCCKVCNLSKNVMNSSQFISWVQKVYSHQKELLNVR